MARSAKGVNTLWKVERERGVCMCWMALIDVFVFFLSGLVPNILRTMLVSLVVHALICILNPSVTYL